MTDEGRWRGRLLLAASLLTTALFYFLLVPRATLEGALSQAVLYVVVGWVPYTLTWYLVGRLYSSPPALPDMRAADAGLGIFLLLLLASLGLDAWGLGPAVVPAAHVIQAVGILVGLALFGWGIGRRSRAITQVD